MRPVFWIAHGLIADRAEAEDIAQETFATAWRKLGGLELAGDSALPWLATICRNVAANHIRVAAESASTWPGSSTIVSRTWSTSSSR